MNYKKILILAGLAAGTAWAPAQAADKLTYYCSAQEDWCQLMANGFEAETGIKVSMTRQSSGETLAKIKAESAKGYLEYFLDFHQTEVRHFFPEFDRNKDEDKREYYLLTEKTEVAGVLSGIPGEDGSFEIDLDFVIPAYRDCQLGQFMFGEEKAFLKTFGYSKITANAQSQEHQKYLAQIGFEAETNYLWRFKG